MLRRSLSTRTDRVRDTLVRYAWAIAGVVAATALYWPIAPIMAKGHDPSLLFLPIVIACAVRLGFGPAILASFLGFLSWVCIFIPPRFTLMVKAPQDYLALGVYLLAGITTAQLAAQARRKAEESETRGREIALLYRISHIVSGESDPDRMLDTLVQQIAQVCDADRCVVFRRMSDGVLYAAADSTAAESAHGATEQSAFLLAHARQTLMHTSNPAPEDGVDDQFFRLCLRETPVGVLYIAPPVDRQMRPPRDRKTIAALANYAAAVIARQNFTELAQARIQTAAVTEERNRLTREIHDTVAQSLTGIVILLQAADGAGAEEQAAVIAQAGHLAQDCLAEARRSVRALRPGALEGRDLPAAFRDMAARTGGSGGGPQTIFRLVGAERPLPPDFESNLLRIGQEALTNALRHARGATEIVLTLTYETQSVCLRVEDDGCGINPVGATGNGFGMTSMRERASQMHASLSVEAAENGGGATILVVAPLPPSSNVAGETFGKVT